jgi:hypothetical protein
LSAKEKEILTRVYRGSVSLHDIRLIDGFAGLFNVNTRPFTLGNKIYIKHIRTDADPATLALEVCPVWQYWREGIRYITDALWAQWTIPNAYNWMKEIQRGKTRWQEFNYEVQAQLIQDVYNSGQKAGPAHVIDEFFDDEPIHQSAEFKGKGVDDTELARSAITLVCNKGKRCKIIPSPSSKRAAIPTAKSVVRSANNAENESKPCSRACIRICRLASPGRRC